MSNKSEELPRVQNAVDKKKLTCHLVSLPRIILRRIDEGTLSTANKASPLKKPLKRLGSKNIKTQSSSKSSASKIKKGEKRPKNRPKPGQSVTVQKANLKKALKGTLEGKKINAVKKSLKEGAKPQSAIKSMLKKTMLQKRSKVAIPSAKKDKAIPTKSTKTTPTIKPKKLSSPNKNIGRTPKLKKRDSPNINIDILPTKPLYTDTSEDEFLYDELIEELENSPMNQSEPLKVVPEKTTNITIKPNVGNKPPTVVKGGIVKKTNLPADLHPIASPNNITSFKEDIDSSKPITDTMKATTTRKKKMQNSSDSPVLPKKPSPWPVSISSPSKPSLEANSKKAKRNAVKKTKSTQNVSNTKSPQIQPKVSPQPSLVLIKPVNNIVSKPASLNAVKPKIGPKQTAKVVPMSKTFTHDDNLSDEYTEEETLESIDSEPLDILSKQGGDPVISNKSVEENFKTPLKPTLSTSCTSKDDEDPHLDLLRILTDDSDEPVTLLKPVDESNEINMQTRTSLDESKESQQTLGKISTETDCDQTNGATSDNEEETPARTIYDLMNEVSLQYPSWNLHIIPETNAFCIAQVTRGRLGLPTLKKCIELDPIDYNAKVYIHQYHIKRFDGVYDSEESIIALIQEINSIKA